MSQNSDIERAISLVFSGTGRRNNEDGGEGIASVARGLFALNNRLALKTDTSGNLVVTDPDTPFTTTLVFTQPTANRTITFPDASLAVAGGAASVITTKGVTAAENGATFFLDLAAGFVTTLPAPALGLRYTFIVKTAPSGGSYTIVTAGGAVANIIKGQAYVAADAAGDTGTADDTITFVDGQAVAGDMVQVYSDGTSWFAKGFVAVAAGLTFTQASA